MNKLNKEILNNLKFEYNPCLELAALIGLLGDIEKYEALNQEFNYNILNKYEELLDKSRNSLSNYLKKEIEYFYSISLPIHNIIFAYVEDYNLSNIDALLETMENSTDIVLLNYLGGIFASSESKKETKDWSEVKNNIAAMKDYISKNIEGHSKRANFLECADNIEETKQRLLLIFKQVYRSVFVNIETEVLAIIENYSKTYEALLNINPVEFVKKYLFNIFDPVNNEWKYKIKIHFSLFLIMGFQVISLHDYLEKEGRCLLGIHTNDMFKSKNMKDKLDKFSRALADDRRINIIKLLAEKPYYGYELAGKLNLTPATINYHMNFLLLADLLIFEKVDNKVYYTLNKENLKELFGEFQKYLLNE